MMSVLEYANDVNKTVEEILKKCRELGIDVKNEDDELDEEAIISLDNASFDEEDALDDIAEKIIEKENISVDNTVKKQKLKKKNEYNNKSNKKELAEKKKAMYKNKEKLQSNTSVSSEKIILYKENMTVGELANRLGVSGAELVKKLFMLGTMATVNNSIDFENAEVLVLDYGKELKREETADVVAGSPAVNEIPQSATWPGASAHPHILDTANTFTHAFPPTLTPSAHFTPSAENQLSPGFTSAFSEYPFTLISAGIYPLGSLSTTEKYSPSLTVTLSGSLTV